MCVCVCEYVYVYAYVCAYVRMYVRTCVYTHVCMYVRMWAKHAVAFMAKPGFFSWYRVSQEERTKLRESVPYVKLYRYNPKHLYPKLNGYGDNGHRKVWVSVVSTYCKPSVTSYSSTAQARQRETTR